MVEVLDAESIMVRDTLLTELTLLEWRVKPFNLAAGNLLKLWFPALSGLGYEQKNKTVPGFAKFVVCHTLHEQENAKWPFR